MAICWRLIACLLPVVTAWGSVVLAQNTVSKADFEESHAEASEYTPLGAERSGNTAGTIPPWTGGITTVPKNYDPEKHEIDPYPEDVPLYTITSTNLEQYKDLLSPGQRALIDAYPDTWELHVYPTRRSASYPPWVYEGVKTNGKNIDPGKPLEVPLYKLARVSSPYPFPTNGEQVMWNHNLRWRALRVQRALANAAVTTRGRYTLIRGHWDIAFPYGTPQATKFSERHPNLMLAFISRFTSPSLLANNATLILEPIDHSQTQRSNWSYLNSIRRVIRRPFQGYGFPAPNTDSLRTIDDLELFNGDTDRFSWQLLGKREMLIPYNSYRLHSSDVDSKDVITPGHINPELARYELHRVWVVEATLKPGERHVYSKRVFYVDEDSWQIAVSESYDQKGKLWRVAEAHAVNFYTVPVLLSTLDVFHDLKNGRYLVEGLDNNLEPYLFLDTADEREFSPNSLLYQVR